MTGEESEVTEGPNEPWGGVWEPIQREFAAVVEHIRRAMGEVYCNQGWYQTEVFPLTAYLSLGLAEVREELVVISVGFQAQGSTIRATSDLTFTDGQFISIGPEAELQLAILLDTGTEWGTYVTAVCDWIRGRGPAILSVLEVADGE